MAQDFPHRAVCPHGIWWVPRRTPIWWWSDADLVVVGSRGGGGFSKLLLGSMSNQVVSHAACPVVVIPA